jgi:hypothetical protein
MRVKIKLPESVSGRLKTGIIPIAPGLTATALGHPRTHGREVTLANSFRRQFTTERPRAMNCFRAADQRASQANGSSSKTQSKLGCAAVRVHCLRWTTDVFGSRLCTLSALWPQGRTVDRKTLIESGQSIAARSGTRGESQPPSNVSELRRTLSIRAGAVPARMSDRKVAKRV